MKTQFNYLLIACLATTLCISNTFGQPGVKKSITAARFEYGDKLGNPARDGSFTESRISERVLTSFSNSFPEATNTKWYGVGKMYGVDFIKNEKQHKCLYNLKGHLIYSLSYGSEKDLPRDIRREVKREYIDYNITQAVEAHEDNRNVWIINLEDDDNFISVGVEDGSIEELSHYKKLKN